MSAGARAGASLLRAPEGAAGLRGAAFFDLDRTLIAGSSAFAFGRAAARAGLISRRALAVGAMANLRFRLRGAVDDDVKADTLRQQVMGSLAGQRVLDIERLTPAMLAAVLPRILPGILELAWAHQDAGRPAYICSATSTEVAELMAIVLRLDGGLGTRSEIVDGHYTGRNEGPFTYGEGKAQAVRELAAAQGIELSGSYAYSDAIFRRAVPARGGSPGGGQPGRRAAAPGRPGGVGGHPRRSPRSASADGRGQPGDRRGRSRCPGPAAALSAAGAGAPTGPAQSPAHPTELRSWDEAHDYQAFRPATLSGVGERDVAHGNSRARGDLCVAAVGTGATTAWAPRNSFGAPASPRAQLPGPPARPRPPAR